MPEIHYRIFEYENHQMLAKKDFEPDEDCFKITFEIVHDGVCIALSMNYRSEEGRNAVWEHADFEKHARKMYNQIIQIIS